MERLTILDRVGGIPLFDRCWGTWHAAAQKYNVSATPALILFFLQFAKDVQGGDVVRVQFDSNSSELDDTPLHLSNPTSTATSVPSGNANGNTSLTSSHPLTPHSLPHPLAANTTLSTHQPASHASVHTHSQSQSLSQIQSFSPRHSYFMSSQNTLHPRHSTFKKRSVHASFFSPLDPIPATPSQRASLPSNSPTTNITSSINASNTTSASTTNNNNNALPTSLSPSSSSFHHPLAANTRLNTSNAASNSMTMYCSHDEHIIVAIFVNSQYQLNGMNESRRIRDLFIHQFQEVFLTVKPALAQAAKYPDESLLNDSFLHHFVSFESELEKLGITPPIVTLAAHNTDPTHKHQSSASISSLSALTHSRKMSQDGQTNSTTSTIPPNLTAGPSPSPTDNHPLHDTTTINATNNTNTNASGGTNLNTTNLSTTSGRSNHSISSFYPALSTSLPTHSSNNSTSSYAFMNNDHFLDENLPLHVESWQEMEMRVHHNAQQQLLHLQHNQHHHHHHHQQHSQHLPPYHHMKHHSIQSHAYAQNMNNTTSTTPSTSSSPPLSSSMPPLSTSAPTPSLFPAHKHKVIKKQFNTLQLHHTLKHPMTQLSLHPHHPAAAHSQVHAHSHSNSSSVSHLSSQLGFFPADPSNSSLSIKLPPVVEDSSAAASPYSTSSSQQPLHPHQRLSSVDLTSSQLLEAKLSDSDKESGQDLQSISLQVSNE